MARLLDSLATVKPIASLALGGQTTTIAGLKFACRPINCGSLDESESLREHQNDRDRHEDDCRYKNGCVKSKMERSNSLKQIKCQRS